MKTSKTLAVTVREAAITEGGSLTPASSASAPANTWDQAMAMAARASTTGDSFYERGDYATAGRYYELAELYYYSAAA